MIRRWREMDSNLYGAFPCQVVVFGLLPKAQEQQERYLYRSQYLEHLRENWAHVVNRHLRRHGFEGALDHRSFLSASRVGCRG
jgi:hypothetical protein